MTDGKFLFICLYANLYLQYCHNILCDLGSLALTSSVCEDLLMKIQQYPIYFTDFSCLPIVFVIAKNKQYQTNNCVQRFTAPCKRERTKNQEECKYSKSLIEDNHYSTEGISIFCIN